MPTRKQRIDRAINKYGSNVVLTYQPKLPREDDWPDPSAPPVQVPKDPVTLKALVVPLADSEGRDITEAGNQPIERVQAFFTAEQELNDVWLIKWRGGDYRIESQDAYELGGGLLAQSTILVRTAAEQVMPHA